MAVLALRALLFYSYTFVLCSLAFLGCTIIGDDPESLGFEKTELLRIGKFSPQGLLYARGAYADSWRAK